MLFWNNENPIKYSLNEFSYYFGIEPEEMRKILKTVSYPLVGRRNNQPTKILRFIEFN